MDALLNLSLLEGMAIGLVLQLLVVLWLLKSIRQQGKLLNNHEEKIQQALITPLAQLQTELHYTWQNSQQAIHERIAQGQITIQQLINDSIRKQMADVREQMTHSFTLHSSSLTSHLQSLTEEIRNHLHNLTQQVQHKLTEGFEKTSSTFIDVVKRLTIIDEAQKKSPNSLRM